jgi:phosphoserine phosphatase
MLHGWNLECLRPRHCSQALLIFMIAVAAGGSLDAYSAGCADSTWARATESSAAMTTRFNYLKANDFDVFIVSGGGIEFMRPWTEKIYGIPSENVVGSSIKMKYEVKDGKPVIMRLAEVNFVDDKEGKPVGINSHIGKRPIAAFGNSDGDFQMLEWTTSGDGPRFGMIVHHDDAVREVAYDRNSHVGKLDKGLDEGPKRGWTITSMKTEWKCIFPHECKGGD